MIHDGGPAPLDGSVHGFSVVYGKDRVKNAFLESDILDVVAIQDGLKVRHVSVAPCGCWVTCMLPLLSC